MGPPSASNHPVVVVLVFIRSRPTPPLSRAAGRHNIKVHTFHRVGLERLVMCDLDGHATEVQELLSCEGYALFAED
jgi:hypothetical protein